MQAPGDGGAGRAAALRVTLDILTVSYSMAHAGLMTSQYIFALPGACSSDRAGRHEGTRPASASACHSRPRTCRRETGWQPQHELRLAPGRTEGWIRFRRQCLSSARLRVICGHDLSGLKPEQAQAARRRSCSVAGQPGAGLTALTHGTAPEAWLSRPAACEGSADSAAGMRGTATPGDAGGHDVSSVTLVQGRAGEEDGSSESRGCMLRQMHS